MYDIPAQSYVYIYAWSKGIVLMKLYEYSYKYIYGEITGIFLRKIHIIYCASAVWVFGCTQSFQMEMPTFCGNFTIEIPNTSKFVI